VLLPYERSPTLRVQSISFSSRVPEIDSADRVPVLRQDIVLACNAFYALVFRGCAQECPSCLVPRVMGVGNSYVAMTVIIGLSFRGNGDCERRLTTKLSGGGGHGELEVPEINTAPAVCCSDWFGALATTSMSPLATMCGHRGPRASGRRVVCGRP